MPDAGLPVDRLIDLKTGEIREYLHDDDDPAGIRAVGRDFADETDHSVAVFPAERDVAYVVYPGTSTVQLWTSDFDRTVQHIADVNAMQGELDAPPVRASRMRGAEPSPLFPVAASPYSYAVRVGATHPVTMPLAAANLDDAERYALDMAYAIAGVPIELLRGDDVVVTLTGGKR